MRWQSRRAARCKRPVFVSGSVLTAEPLRPRQFHRHTVGVAGAGLPYTTLGYANGPGHTGASNQQPEDPKRFLPAPSSAGPAHGRPDLSQVDTPDPHYLHTALVPLNSEAHGGAAVGI